MGAASTSVSGFNNAINRGYEYASSTGSFLEAVTKMQEKSSSNKSNSFSESEVALKSQVQPSSTIATVTAAVGVVKGLLGVVKTFTGGAKSASNTQNTLEFSRIVQTTGTAQTTSSLYHLQFTPYHNEPLSAHRYVPTYTGQVGMIGPIRDYTLFTREMHFVGTESGLCGHFSGVMNFYVNKDMFDQFDSSFDAFREGIRLDTVKTAVMQNFAVDTEPLNGWSGEDSFLFLPRLPTGIPEIDASNEGLVRGTRSTNWKTVYPGGVSDDFLTYGYFRFSPWDFNPLVYSVYYRANDPVERLLSYLPRFIALEIKYTITAPDYPDEEGRERVIYKVIEVNAEHILEREKYGCPLPPVG